MRKNEIRYVRCMESSVELPCHNMKEYEFVEVEVLSFLISTLDKKEWSQLPAVLPPQTLFW